jgi:hypothetical protein
VIDPQGPPIGSNRVVRGGGWHDVAGNCRSAYRLYVLPDDKYFDLGFRVVLASGNPCLHNHGGCIASQTCIMTSGGRICSGNSCGIVQCNLDSECQTLCGGVCLPQDSNFGSPRYCDNRPRSVNTCNLAIGCNNNLDCQTSCGPGAVCVPPDYSGGGSYGHCDNSQPLP